MATVKEIQVCGGKLVKNLKDACREYLACLDDGTDREKINFSITLADGRTKSITIRQDGNQVVAYGSFEGLPNALEWAQEKEVKMIGLISDKKIYEITRKGGTYHKYDIYRLYDTPSPFHRIHAGTLIGESPEKLCEQHHWQREDYEFIPIQFSMWDISDNAIPVRDKKVVEVGEG